MADQNRDASPPSQKQLSVVLIGHVCIDMNTTERGESYESWGSTLMYMAHYFDNRLGLEPTLVAGYGPDFEKYKSFSMRPPQPTAQSTLQYENDSSQGHRTQRCRYAESALPIPFDKALVELVATADIIVVAPLLPNYSVRYIDELLRYKKAGTLTALLPQGYMRTVDPGGNILTRPFHEAPGILKYFDLVIFSENDCPDIQTIRHDWMKAKDTHIVMTQGADGASYITTDKIIAVPTVAVPRSEIVDSVGCGDIFSAAAIHDYFMRKQIIEAIEAGHEAARNKLLLTPN